MLFKILNVIFSLNEYVGFRIYENNIYVYLIIYKSKKVKSDLKVTHIKRHCQFL